jgi:hypothetical protein
MTVFLSLNFVLVKVYALAKPMVNLSESQTRDPPVARCLCVLVDSMLKLTIVLTGLARPVIWVSPRTLLIDV